MRKHLLLAALVVVAGSSCSDGGSPADTGVGGATAGTDGIAGSGGSTGLGGTTGLAGTTGLWWKASFGSSTSGPVMEAAGWTWVTRNQDGVNDVAWRPLAVGPTGDVSGSQLSPSPWANVFVVVQPP